MRTSRHNEWGGYVIAGAPLSATIEVFAFFGPREDHYERRKHLLEKHERESRESIPQ